MTNKEKKQLINHLWNLWEALAESGEISIGSTFSKTYDELKDKVEEVNKN